MSKKHLKYTPDYNEQLALLIPQKVKDTNGQEQNIVKRLLTERETLNNQITKLAADIKKTGNHYGAVRYLKKRIELWEATANYQTYSDNFHLGGYNWDAKVKNWYQNPNYTDNLYRLNLNGTIHEITEEEVLNLMARVVEALKDIDDTDLIAKYTGSETTPISYITSIKNEGALIKVGSGKTSRKSYHFPETYPQQPNNYTPYAGTRIYREFFEFIKAVKADESFLNNLDDNLQSKVPSTEKYHLFLKGDKYTASQLKDYGIEIKANQSLYKTGSTKKEFEVKGGIKGWIDLANTIIDSNNQTKLLNSLTRTNNPNWNLFNDLLASVNANTANLEGISNPDNTFQKGGHTYGLDTLPRSLDEYQQQLSIFKSKTGADNVRVAKWMEELDKKTDEKTQKETEIDKLITDQLKELRTQLVSFKIAEGFELTKKADGTVDKDNRRTQLEIQQIKSLLEDIRYLENDGDEELSSSVTEENTAYQKLSKISNQSLSTLIYHLVAKGGTEQEKIKHIQTDKLEQTFGGLQRYLDEFNKIEELVKLNPKELQLKKAIETALGKKDDTETLKTYTDILKAFETSLETSFTEDLKTKWQSEKSFQNSTSLKTLLETVKDKEAFFNHIKGGVNGYEEVKEVDNWGKLLVKDPKVVITVIKRYEYDNLDDTGEDKDKDKTQMERKIKKVLNKKGTDNLTDKEINDTLYEVAIGTKTLSAKALKADLSEYEVTDEQTPKSHLRTWWPLYLIGSILLVGGICVAIFWDQIKKWWSPEESSEESE